MTKHKLCNHYVTNVSPVGTVDFTLLEMSMSVRISMECNCEVSTLRVPVLASTHLYLYKHTHADMLTPRYLSEVKATVYSTTLL